MRAVRIAVVASSLLLMMPSAACRKTPPDATADAAASAAPSASEAPRDPVDAGAGARPVRLARRDAPFAEARRTRIAKLSDDRALAEQADALSRIWGAVPAAMRVQRAELTSASRRAIFVEPDPPDGRAFVVVGDDQGEPAWTKDRPAGGIMPPVGRMAIAPGPRGRVMLAVCDPPTKTVAAREWDEDGSAFADFQALAVEACDDVSVLYWQHHGWVIVAAGLEGSRAQLLTESGGLAWGPSGAAVGGRWRAAAPASIAADSDTSVILVQLATVAGADHALAYRYDERGASLWPTPIDLGAVRVDGGRERIEIDRPRPGVVRATLPGSPASAVNVMSNGEVTRPR